MGQAAAQPAALVAASWSSELTFVVAWRSLGSVVVSLWCSCSHSQMTSILSWLHAILHIKASWCFSWLGLYISAWP